MRLYLNMPLETLQDLQWADLLRRYIATRAVFSNTVSHNLILPSAYAVLLEFVSKIHNIETGCHHHLDISPSGDILLELEDL